MYFFFRFQSLNDVNSVVMFLFCFAFTALSAYIHFMLVSTTVISVILPRYVKRTEQCLQWKCAIEMQ